MQGNLSASSPAFKPQNEDTEDDEDLQVAETYTEYMPKKVKIGGKHPDRVVETASLATVEPNDVWYELSLPKESIKNGALSALQLEAIVYASQQHHRVLSDGFRAGFLIGDGAGVGKGRTIAGILQENFLKGRKKAIWVSVSNDLKYDSERDLQDIGASDIPVYPLNKMKYSKIPHKTGVIFSTYSSLIGESHQSGSEFCTRLDQLVKWCGKTFDGVIVFDECHRAKNLCPSGCKKPTKTGVAVLNLQNQLPKARIVYSSATGANEPRSMAYMVRLGLWGKGTPFANFQDFQTAVEKRGVSAMEIVAMEMKQRGMYIARQLSFHGVSFKIQQVPLSPEFVQMYDDSVKLWEGILHAFNEKSRKNQVSTLGQFWSAHQRFFKYLCIAAKVKCAVHVARAALKNDKCVVIGLQSTGEARTLDQLERGDGELTAFVSSAKGVMLSLVEKHYPVPDGENKKVPVKRKAARQPRRKGVKRLKLNRAAPFAEVECRTDGDASDDSLDSNEATSLANVCQSKRRSLARQKVTAKAHFDRMNCKGSSDSDSNTASNGTFVRKLTGRHKVSKSQCMSKGQLLKSIEELGKRLPPNALDHLMDELGGPEKVAEMTGRKGHVIRTKDGVQYQMRSEQDVENNNLREKERFMAGEKYVAIISEAASSGISLQSDRRAKNQRRRVHITLELPWCADQAIQQFGRTHRSNQVNAPEYVLLISDLAGEQRFASIVANRLESLGALTRGDGGAQSRQDLSRFTIDSNYGQTALQETLDTVMGAVAPTIPVPQDYKGADFFGDVRTALISVGLVAQPKVGELKLEKDSLNISKFLNRLLGMPVDLQNRLFKYFTDTLNKNIKHAKNNGRFDLGVLDLNTAGEKVKQVTSFKFHRKQAARADAATIELHIVQAERGMCWVAANDMNDRLTGPREGFWLSNKIRGGRKAAILAVAADDQEKKPACQKLFVIYRPNSGLQPRQRTLAQLKKEYTMATSKDAEWHWRQQYAASATMCSHVYWTGKCKNEGLKNDCEVGLRRRKYNILSGAVISAWPKIEKVMACRTNNTINLQMMRLTIGGVKIIGTVIPNSCVEALREALSSDAEKTEVVSFNQTCGQNQSNTAGGKRCQSKLAGGKKCQLKPAAAESKKCQSKVAGSRRSQSKLAGGKSRQSKAAAAGSKRRQSKQIGGKRCQSKPTEGKTNQSKLNKIDPGHSNESASDSQSNSSIESVSKESKSKKRTATKSNGSKKNSTSGVKKRRKQ